jgi:hypothetical protein
VFRTLLDFTTTTNKRPLSKKKLIKYAEGLMQQIVDINPGVKSKINLRLIKGVGIEP